MDLARPSPVVSRSPFAPQHNFGKSHSSFISRRFKTTMSVREASAAHSLGASPDSGPAPLAQRKDLEAVLDAEIATHATILTVIGDCERQLAELSASTSLQDPNIRYLRHALSYALQEASQSNARQSTLRMQLRMLSAHQQKLEGQTSGLRLAMDRLVEARNESLRMEFTASSRVFDFVTNGARLVVIKVASLCEKMLGQGAWIGRAWSGVWERLRVDSQGEVKEDEGNLEGGKGEEGEAKNEEAEKE